MFNYLRNAGFDKFVAECVRRISAASLQYGGLDPRHVSSFAVEVEGIMTSCASNLPSGTNHLTTNVTCAESVGREYLICFQCGKSFKTLKRHLREKHNMTPAQYRRRWGLQADYPIVTESYSRKRSRIAKEVGLGKGRK
ncbi:MucR family transcriptional regulator [Tepidicaulis sp. LMO-SS28]|uniref:MucR family transcriptional regulator n=1 Tax=Tepidicaulis sp. LMO-SS28 TaxID=3447455 RepID=UPI003EE08B52